jgi:HEAT repeat protein
MSHSSSLSGTINGRDASSQAPDWLEVCRSLLDRFLPCTSVNTQPEVVLNQGAIVPKTLKVLSTVKTKTAESSSKSYSPSGLLDAVGQWDSTNGRGRRLGIFGEAGSGKTLFLQHCARELLRRYQAGTGTSLPIWVSPSQLKEITIKDYLLGPWLEQAAQDHPQVPPATWRSSLEAGVEAGLFWLFADGMDYLICDTNEGVGTKGPLSWLKTSLSGLTGLNVMVSCREETRRSDAKGLAGFALYQTQHFVYPQDVEMAIADCLGGDSSAAGSAKEKHGDDDLVLSLCRTLASPLVEPLREYLISPIRLILCCRFWQHRPSQFPQTSAGLYGELVEAFYQWKTELCATTVSQRTDINRLLGELGKQMLINHHPDHQPLSQGDVENIFGKQSASLRLALQLEWLIPRGLVRKGAWERGYGFFDRSFRDYFTALVIADWRFFLDVYQHHYRIFEVEWQPVIRFWLGRSDIELQHKTEFIEALLDFDDRCSPENFYGWRAFREAALALQEVPDCPHGDTIVQKLLNLSLPNTKASPTLHHWATQLLEQTSRSRVIHELLSTLKRTNNDAVYQQCCQWLCQWGHHQPSTIAVLEGELERHATELSRFTIAETLATLQPNADAAIQPLLAALEPGQDSYSRALAALSRCAVGNGAAIQALLSLLSQNLSVLHHRQTLQCLEAIAQDDGLVEATLLQRLRIYPEGPFRCQLAESLEKIDPGNPTALSVLQRHTQGDKSLDIRKQAIFSLGEVSAPSPIVFNCLAALLKPDEDVFVRWLAVSSLAKIGKEQPAAIAALADLLEATTVLDHSEETDWLLNETIQALLKIDPTNGVLQKSLEYLLENAPESDNLQAWAEMLGRLDPGNPVAINTLLRLLKQGDDEYAQRQAASSLATIDPGNLSALMVLINLLHNSQNKNVRQAAAQHLGLAGKNNPAAMAALIRTTLSPGTDGETLRVVVKALAKIGQNNKEVAQTLLGLMRHPLEDRLRQEVAQALVTTLPNKLLITAVYQLREFCTHPRGENHRGDWQLFWYCAHQLSYADFYQAWHQRPLGGAGTTLPGRRAKQRSFFHYLLDQTLKSEEDPLAQYQVIWINASQFLSPDTPSIDIYDQMLCQGCPEFVSGIPDTLSKLRLYWHQLQRQADPPRLLLFEELSQDDPPAGWEALLEQLTTFQGAIAVLSLSPPSGIVTLPYFQLQDSQTTAADIVNWLRNFDQP